jgi:hypothetical protein
MGVSGDGRFLYRGLKALADGELLLVWAADLPTLDSAPVRELQAAGLIFPYRAGRPRRRYCYLVGLYEPGDQAGPGSLLPPPSLQTAATWSMYGRRDCQTCHLCERPVVEDWKRPNEFHSLDHLVPRSKGGSGYPSNIRLSHVSCNKARRNRDVVEFRAWLASRHDGRGSPAQGARA